MSSTTAPTERPPTTTTTTTTPSTDANPKHKNRHPRKKPEPPKMEATQRIEESKEKYVRNKLNLPIKSIQDKKLKATLRKTESKFSDAAQKAAQSELLLTESSGYLEAEGMERTYKFRQEEIKAHVDLNTQSKMFNLNLPDFGPYTPTYTSNGVHLLLSGRKGHVAAFDWKSKKLHCELHLRETVRDSTWLHNETLFAVAQKKYTYIYDKTGMEIHCLRKFVEMEKLTFLPYHYLLAGVGKSGMLKYQDTSTGSLVAELPTRLGPCTVLAQNPHNAILHLGHTNGTVTLWSPTVSTPLVKMLTHRAPLQTLTVDPSGLYMATAALDGQLKVWDIRTFQQPLHSYFTPTPPTHVSISQKGLLGVSFGPNLHIWKDALVRKASGPYMVHRTPSAPIHSFSFCPFEDVLGLGTSKSFESVVVPGSGEANYDALESNPYETLKQRKTKEVRTLLDKLQPEMIVLNPEFVGMVERGVGEVSKMEERLRGDVEKFEPKRKAKGKSSSMRRYLRKQANVVDPNRAAVLERFEKEKEEREKERKRKKGEVVEKEWDPLDRFTTKKKRV
ncbi:Small subunit (SSU) processome component [Chytridiales sp. JEL 0842]|nr:Small subunit (SSU) processome component [Chytridiales sp. JEL 0842]